MRQDDESARLLRKHMRQEGREQRQQARSDARTYRTGARMEAGGKRQLNRSVASGMNKRKGYGEVSSRGLNKRNRYATLDAQARIEEGRAMMKKGAPRKKVYGITRHPNSPEGKRMKR